jgi:hypothetical protein
MRQEGRAVAGHASRRLAFGMATRHIDMKAGPSSR